MDDTGSTSHSTVQDISSQHASILSTVRALPETILMCYSVATSPKVVYNQQLNSLTLSQFEETDHVFYPTLVRATRNMWGFPLGRPHHALEMGVTSFSAILQRRPVARCRRTPTQNCRRPGTSSTPRTGSHTWDSTPKIQQMVAYQPLRMGCHVPKSLMQTGYQTSRRLHSSSHHH